MCRAWQALRRSHKRIWICLLKMDLSLLTRILELFFPQWQWISRFGFCFVNLPWKREIPSRRRDELHTCCHHLENIRRNLDRTFWETNAHEKDRMKPPSQTKQITKTCKKKKKEQTNRHTDKNKIKQLAQTSYDQMTRLIWGFRKQFFLRALLLIPFVKWKPNPTC